MAREGDPPSSVPPAMYNHGMTIVTLAEIQRDPGGVLRRVEGGETIRVVRGTVPVAEIIPIAAASPGLQGGSTNGAHTRPFGLCAGEFAAPADCDAPLPEGVVREFEG